MKAYCSRRYQLSASHRLFCADLDADENSALFGKCANPYGHGHNYQVEVTVSGALDEVTGMVCDLPALDACVQNSVLAEYDHTNLNLHEDFRERVPTTENFCIAVYERLARAMKAEGGQLAEVRVEETSNNAFVYAGGAATLEALHRARAAGRLRTGRRETKN
jgi:6-pyruvoyltetrahydropterin/6-carboxytetrahydropterin synthase